MFVFVYKKQKTKNDYIGQYDSFKFEKAQVQVNHFVALTLDIEILEVNVTFVGLAVCDVCHADHVVLFLCDENLTRATVHIFHLELFSIVLSTGGKDLHDFLRDDVCGRLRRRGCVSLRSSLLSNAITSLRVQRCLVGTGAQLDKHWCLLVLASYAVALGIIRDQNHLVFANILDKFLVSPFLIGLGPFQHLFIVGRNTAHELA